jgi:hypothetical protein
MEYIMNNTQQQNQNQGQKPNQQTSKVQKDGKKGQNVEVSKDNQDPRKNADVPRANKAGY